MTKTMVATFAALLLSACAGTQQYTPSVTRDTLKTGNALIRVERQSGFLGAGHSVEITDNGTKTGTLSPGNAIAWERPAGPMDISLAPASLLVKTLPPIHVEVEAGQEYEFVTFWSWNANSFVIQRK